MKTFILLLIAGVLISCSAQKKELKQYKYLSNKYYWASVKTGDSVSLKKFVKYETKADSVEDAILRKRYRFLYGH
jgi:hypothetical protein